MTKGIFIADAKDGIAVSFRMGARVLARPSSSRALLLLSCP
jgi:hypothetical protein